MKIITDERCMEYSSFGHPERPARIRMTLDKLRAQKELAIAWAKPMDVKEEQILRAHTAEHVRRIDQAAYDFDGDTPAHDDIGEHARRSVGAALQALQFARQGEQAFCLIRPPGHHATQDRAMGFCYFNSIAIAALEALATGIKRLAVYDFDVHHGNGTEAILLDRPNLAFYSVHQHPCYPGTGIRDRGNNCFNYPVAPHTPRTQWRRVLASALEDLQGFKPDMVAVSAGFDAYAGDPLAQGTLLEEDFHWLGESIRTLGIPAFRVLEGGYSDDLPDLIEAYLRGLAGKEGGVASEQ